jgi:hypothetical protein
LKKHTTSASPSAVAENAPKSGAHRAAPRATRTPIGIARISAPTIAPASKSSKRPAAKPNVSKPRLSTMRAIKTNAAKVAAHNAISTPMRMERIAQKS